jgi:hypothetical protein
MQHFIFPANMPLNNVLINAGIETTVINGKKFLTYEGVTIPRPPHQHLEFVINERFNIKITYKN